MEIACLRLVLIDKLVLPLMHLGGKLLFYTLDGYLCRYDITQKFKFLVQLNIKKPQL